MDRHQIILRCGIQHEWITQEIESVQSTLTTTFNWFLPNSVQSFETDTVSASTTSNFLFKPKLKLYGYENETVTSTIDSSFSYFLKNNIQSYVTDTVTANTTSMFSYVNTKSSQ